MTPPLPLRTYLKVFWTLLMLTILTTGVAYVDLGVFNGIVALTIAVLKALLVALFFMHLIGTNHRTQVVAGAGILWLIILIVFTVSDVTTRNLLTRPMGW